MAAMRPLAHLSDGRAVDAPTLFYGRGLVPQAINHGSIVTALCCPGRSAGNAAD